MNFLKCLLTYPTTKMVLELLQVGSTIWVGFLAMVTGNDKHVFQHGNIVTPHITKVNRHWEGQEMRLVALFCACLFLPGVAESACPSRDNSYIAGTTIEPADVMANEDALFEGIQNGLATDCIANNAITTDKIATSGVTTSDILNGTILAEDLAFSVSGTTLPAGAAFFMLTGSCPSWTTDVTATYTNRFLRVNATGSTTGGTDTHNHTAGTYVGVSHTHSVTDPATGWSSTADTAVTGKKAGSGGGNAYEIPSDRTLTTTSGGSGAITGTSATSDNIPAFVTGKLCRVN